MSENVKRPKLVWTIFIFFMFSGFWGLYNFYGLSTGIVKLPEGFPEPSGPLYYIKSVISLALIFLSAVLLFLRQEIAKWFFLGYLIYTIILGIYSTFFSTLPGQLEENKALYFGMKIIPWIIYAFIVRYTFGLKEKNYYTVAKST